MGEEICINKAFLDELGAASIIEKKPLLCLTCRKVRFFFQIIAEHVNEVGLIMPNLIDVC